MHEVTPKAIIMAETKTDDGLHDFLDAIGADNWRIPEGVKSQGELLIEVAGRTCYKSFGTALNANLTKVRTDHSEYIGNILATKHGSVLEHSTVTIGLVNVSRILTHELVRHRAGCAYSQESMRFVRLDDIGMFFPSCIQDDSHAKDLFIEAVKNAEESYDALVKHMITDDMPFAKKKEITSAIRRIAPSGHSTNIIITANHRALRHLIELRTAPGVEEEIGILFSDIANQLTRKFPAFYQDAMFLYNPNQAWRTVEFENGKI